MTPLASDGGSRSAPQQPGSGIDRVNRSSWSDERTLAAFDPSAPTALECFTDAGERAMFLAIAPGIRGQPVLDVGVGGGRTTTLFALITDDYVGIDYMDEMVERTRRAHRDADVSVGDVRDLSAYGDGQFALAMFSFNGLDAVDHEDRRRGLAELHRVLRPGGLLAFSTHNKSGPAYRATPWHPAGPIDHAGWSPPRRLAWFAGNLAIDPGHHPRSFRNWNRLRRLGEDHGDWAIGPVEAHDFSLLVHFTELGRQRADLDALGFDVVSVFEAETGRSVPPGVVTTTRYFHLIARKR